MKISSHENVIITKTASCDETLIGGSLLVRVGERGPLSAAWVWSTAKPRSSSLQVCLPTDP